MTAEAMVSPALSAPEPDVDETSEAPAADVAAENVPAPEPEDDVERIDPLPTELTLSTGRVVLVNRLRAREFFKLLRIITRGGSAVLQGFNLNAEDTDAFVGQLMALVIFAIPEADDETLDFLFAITEPKLPTSATAADRDKARQEYAIELNNPELDDMVEIIGNVVQREAADLQALGKKLQKLLVLARKTGQLPKA